jgi:hypothetical protein
MKDFVTYEPALALKELGFDEPCLAYWYNETPTNSEGQCLVYYKKPWDNQNIINGIIKDWDTNFNIGQDFLRINQILIGFIFLETTF